VTWSATQAEAATRRLVRERREDLLTEIGLGAAGRDEAYIPVPAGFLAAAGRSGLRYLALPREADGEGADPLTWARAFERRSADGYPLSDRKDCMTGGALADVFLTYARTEAGDMTACLVPREDPGVSIMPLAPPGTRTSGSATLNPLDIPSSGDRIVVGTDELTHAQRLLNARRLTVCRAPVECAHARVEMHARPGSWMADSTVPLCGTQSAERHLHVIRSEYGRDCHRAPVRHINVFEYSARGRSRTGMPDAAGPAF